jgi:hypothetical protein
VIGIFKQKNPANLLVLLVIGVLLKLPIFRDPHPPLVRDSDGALYKSIIRALDPVSASISWLYPFLTFGLLFAQAVALTRFINNQRMTTRATYLPGLAYMLITSLLPEWNYFSAPLIVNSILLFILYWVFNIYHKHHVRGAVFNIGLALGVAGFLLISSLTFVVWILLALAVTRPFKVNEWLICLLGVTTPFYFYAIYLVINGTWSWDTILPSVYLGLPRLTKSPWMAASVLLIMVPFLLGGYYVQENLRRMLINVRKAWSLLLLFLLVALLLPFVNTNDTFENWIMAIIPLAAFHGCAYLYAKWNALAQIMFWVMAAFVVAYQYWGPGW